MKHPTPTHEAADVMYGSAELAITPKHEPEVKAVVPASAKPEFPVKWWHRWHRRSRALDVRPIIWALENTPASNWEYHPMSYLVHSPSKHTFAISPRPFRWMLSERSRCSCSGRSGWKFSFVQSWTLNRAVKRWAAQNYWPQEMARRKEFAAQRERERVLMRAQFTNHFVK